MAVPYNGAENNLTVGLGLERQLEALLERERFDLLHVHCPVSPFLPLLALVWTMAFVPVLAQSQPTGQLRVAYFSPDGPNVDVYIDGVRMEHYIAWMKSAYWISATFDPAISVPAGFTADGLPVGVQIAGRRGDDRGVLQLAYAFEQATGCGRRRPPLA